MTDLLQRILSSKENELRELEKHDQTQHWEARITELPPPRGFHQALKHKQQRGRPGIIAEMKRASPSKGLMRRDYNPENIAQSYLQSGADCISVLTDRDYFMGRPQHLTQAAQAGLPVLRKDFIIHPLQIREARILGADCILLITAALQATQAAELSNYARELGMDVLIEVHDEQELAQALDLPGDPVIGINNRDLRTFHTDLEVTRRLLKHIPKTTTTVSESGFHTPEQIKDLHTAGAHAFLIGEAFMRAADPGAKLREMFP